MANKKKPGVEPGSEFALEQSSVADVDLLTPGAELQLDDAATLLLDALLFSEPAVVGHPLGEEGVL